MRPECKRHRGNQVNELAESRIQSVEGRRCVVIELQKSKLGTMLGN